MVKKSMKKLKVEKVIDDPLKFKDKINILKDLIKARKQLNANDSIKVVKGNIKRF